MCIVRSVLFDFRYFVSIVILLTVAFGCSRGPSSKDIAVRINDYTLTSQEFNELFAEAGFIEDTSEAREAFLENLITRKLLLQEAQNEGLDKQKVFLKSIENFWEQALLSIIIERKAKEISGGLRVNEDEMRKYYNTWAETNPDNAETFEDLQELIRWQLLKRKRYSVLNAWIEKLKSNAKIAVDKKTVGIE